MAEKEGSDGDFERWFTDRYGQAVQVAGRIVGSHVLGEDLAQEAFARAYARWWRVGRLPHRDAWVMRVTINLALRKVGSAVALPEVASIAPAFDELVVRRTDLVRALAQLPKRQRDVLALRYLGGLSEEETAARLSIAPGTVKSHAHRGVATLRAQLGAAS